MSLIVDTVSDSVSWFCARRFGSSCRAKPTPFGNMMMLPQSEIVGSVWYSRTAPPCGPDVVVGRTLQQAGARSAVRANPQHYWVASHSAVEVRNGNRTTDLCK